MCDRIFLLLVALIFYPWCSADTTTSSYIELTNQGSSDYCIIHSNSAPASVHLAAIELQTYINKSTGSLLPIVNKDAIPGCAFISLGTNAATKAASLEVDSIPLEGYRILLRGKNIYIFGPDTEDGKKTLQGGKSTGTLNGVYTFLEDYIGVRWLMPGEMGEYVPQLNELKIGQVDRIEKPGFLNRRIPYIQNDKSKVKEWLRRQKQGYSLHLEHGHNFKQLIHPNLFEKHPEWFPMHNGRRVPPIGRYKLETTNPGLIQEFSNNVIKSLDKNSTIFSESISPSDGGNWSTSPESLALYDTDPHGNTSLTPLIIEFYNAVAKQVSLVHTDKWVCGYIYADYLFPPSNGIAPLNNNLCLVIAPNFSYGYGLYREQNKKDWLYILETWSKATKNIAYYDLPTMFQAELGAPNPPGIELLAYIYPRLKQYGMQGVYMYGVSAWGHGGITNYLLAKLNWDPVADVNEVATDFFKHAYGEEAGKIMQELYRLLDVRTKRYHTKHENAHYVLSQKVMKGIYVSILPEIEHAFNKAWASNMMPLERARLSGFKGNMVSFYRYLYEAGFVKSNRYSPFHTTEVKKSDLPSSSGLSDLMQVPKREISLKKSTLPQNINVQELKPQVKNHRPIKSFSLRGDNRALIYSRTGGTVTIYVVVTNSLGQLMEYKVRDKSGYIITSGQVNKKSKIEFMAASKQEYYLDLLTKGGIYKIDVKNAIYALNGEMQKRGLHLNNHLVPLYFNIPEFVDTATVTISADGPKEVASAYILSPTGEVLGELDTDGGLVDRLTIRENGASSNFYQIKWKLLNTGNVDDVWIKLDEDIPSWFFVNPGEIVIYQNVEN